MTIKEITTSAVRLVPLLFLTGLLTGCIKENITDCGTDCVLTVRAYDHTGAELTQSDVSSVYLYVFDGNYQFAGSYQTQIGQSVKLETRSGEDLHIVAWGNLSENINPQIGDGMNDCFVGLLNDSRAGSYSVCPDDIFHGVVTVSGNDRNAEKDVPIYRKVGSMTVTVQNLKAFAGYNDEDYSIVIRETFSNIGFDGCYSGEKVNYAPAGSFIMSGGREVYYVPPFNLIPEESGLYIDLYHGTDWIVRVSETTDGEPIVVRQGLLTNVLIDLTTAVNVSVNLTPWGEEQIWKEF